MLIAAAFVPSPPLLVPELNGLAAAETDELRSAVLDVGSELAEAAEWTVIGVDRAAAVIPATAVGTFRGFGVDTVVSLGPGSSGEPDPALPLAALVAAWVRERTAPRTRAEVQVLPPAAERAGCVALGAQLRARLDDGPVPRALLIVADGAATLTEKAPGAYDPRSEAVESALGAALAAGDPQSLDALDPVLCSKIGLDGRAAWQVLAAAFGKAPSSATVTYAAAPYGVGYHVGLWRP
ncbi:hypothetical protein Q8814_02945 [Rhodococcus sp. CC-R104]|uniref:Aromatic ring-opening dioxygenase LigB n=1 Tax=Rhodococcus chondri TaxID=3065941 RepID=A0ABU7JM25_9NOCA|nr:hypothetical protein [Rhodococcus sp. CC-R104]MEE2031082.1 hypothetical protein [Rhodococcus sp. CC-R104]